MNRVYEIVLGLTAIYCAFNLAKALFTGNAKLWRHGAPSLRGSKDYWRYIGTMVALIIASLLLVFLLKNSN
jgi:hypothetical protein